MDSAKNNSMPHSQSSEEADSKEGDSPWRAETEVLDTEFCENDSIKSNTQNKSLFTVTGFNGSGPNEQSDIQNGKSLSAVNGVIHGATNQQSLKSGGTADVVICGADPFREATIHTNAAWMDDYCSWMTGYAEDEYEYSLFDTSGITELSPNLADACMDDSSLNLFKFDRDRYYINLFFQKRFYKGKKRDVRLSPSVLLRAWNAFVEGYSQPKSFWAHYKKARERFVDRTLTGIKMEVHQQSIKEGFPCGVRQDQDCPFCYKDSKKIPVYARMTDSEQHPVSQKLRLLMIRLDMRCTDEAARQLEEEEASDVVAEGYFEQVDVLQTKKMAATSQLEIIRIKHDNFFLKRQVKELTKNCEELKHATSNLEETVKQLIDKDAKRRCL